MVALPFVVQPRRQPIKELIGSEESGQIEVERRGYLSSGEKSFVQQVQQYDGAANEMITAVRKVARRHKLGMDQAYKLILQIISGAQPEKDQDPEMIASIEEEFAEELTAVVNGMAASQAREDLVFATCMLKYRVNPDFEIDQIAKIHPDIIEGLARLYRDEEAKSLAAFQDPDTAEDEPKKVSFEEAEKKPSKTTGSRSRTTTGG